MGPSEPVDRRILVLTSTFLLALILGCAMAEGHARAAKPRRVANCMVPRGAKIVAQSSHVRIVVLNQPRTELLPGAGGDTQIRREWRYCLRVPRARYHRMVLDADYFGGYGDLVSVGPVVLAADYVAYETQTTCSGGRYGCNPVGALVLRNLVRHTTTSDPVTPDDATCQTQLWCAVGPSGLYCRWTTCSGTPDLILSPTGVAAWQTEEDCNLPGASTIVACSWGIQALDGVTGWHGSLDSTPQGQSHASPDPFADLGLYTCAAGCSQRSGTIASWTRDGVPHRAQLG
jgi:hypothetical protein